MRRLVRGIAQGQVVERTCQANQPLGLLEERFVGALVGHDDAVPDGLQVALQVGQRRTQLVRGVGDDVAALSLALLQLGRHLVEGVGQAGQLVGRGPRHADAQITVGHATGGGTDVSQRPRQHARQGDGEGHAGHDGHDGRHPQHVTDGLVEHGVRGFGGLAVLHHQVCHGLAAHDEHAGGDDAHRDERGDDAHERDAPGQAAADGGAAMGASGRARHAAASPRRPVVRRDSPRRGRS